MLRESHLEIVRTKGTRLGSALIGILFVVSGLSMLLAPDATIQYFGMLNIPAAMFWFWPLVVLKVAAGLALIIGKRTTEAACYLILFTLIATLLAHLSLENDPTFPTGLLKNLAIVGGLLFVLGYGPHGIYVKNEA